jgi:Na+/H+ antiporter NhaD/arsenite permease-like protein
LLASVIFVATYAIVAIGRVPGLPWLDRAGAAVAGALLMVASGALGPRDALAAVDKTTIVLLFAMMVALAPLQLSGVFGRVVAWVSRRIEHPGALLAKIGRARPAGQAPAGRWLVASPACPPRLPRLPR